MALDLAAIMTEAGDLLKRISGLRVFDYEVPTVSGVTAIVGYTDMIEFNQQYGPEGWRFDLPIVLVAPNPTARETRDKLSKYTTTGGLYSVKLALEKPATFTPTWNGYTNFDYATVRSVEFEDVSIASVPYAGALFKVDIAGH